MPLIKSGSKQAISTNIREMVRAGHPQRQAVAAALSTARKYGKKYADGGEVEELQTQEGYPFLQAKGPLPTEDVIPSPGQPLYQAGRSAVQRLMEPAPIKPDTSPEPYMVEEPSEQFAGLGRDAVKSIYENYKDLFSPWSKDEEGKIVAEQPIPQTASGKIPQTTKDPISLGLPIVGDVVSNLAGAPGKGALWGVGKTAMAGLAGTALRGASKEAVKAAEKKILMGGADPNMFPPQRMAELLVTANQGNPETIAFDLFQLAQRNPQYAEDIISNHLPVGILRKVDSYIGEYSMASGIWPFRKLKKEPSPAPDDWWQSPLANKGDQEIESVAGLGPELAEAIGLAHPSHYPWMQTYRSMLPSGGTDRPVAQFLDQHVLPHYDGNLKEFTDKFFAGLYTPSNFAFEPGLDGTVSMTGRFRVGDGAGSMERSINMNPLGGGEPYAYHGFLQIPRDKQGSDIAKNLLKNQFDLYQKMGLGYVKLNANIDVGSYAWAKYGFLPATDQEWGELSARMFNTIQDMARSGGIPKEISDDLLTILERKDRQALWDFVDYPAKIPIGIYGSTIKRQLKWSQALMMNRSWSGKFDLKNPEQMERFNAYIQRGQ